MSRHPLRTPIALTLAVAFALPIGSAQAAPMGSASSSLSNLRLTLVDLDLNDGIDPSLTWVNTDMALVITDMQPYESTPFYGYYNVVETDRQTALQGDPSSALPWASTTLTSSNGTQQLSISNTQFSTQSTLSTDQLVTKSLTYVTSYDNFNEEGQLVTVTTTTTETGTAGGGESSFRATGALSTPEYGSVSAEFQLSPNTLLVLQGTASASVSLDLAALRAMVAAQGADVSTIASASGSARAGIMLAGPSNYADGYDSSPDGLSNESYWIDMGSGNQSASIYADVYGYPESADPTPRSISKNFTFTFVNPQAQATRTGYLLVDLASSLQQFHGTLAQTTTIETAIPEPATYALMGLGLVGIALVRRRA